MRMPIRTLLHTCNAIVLWSLVMVFPLSPSMTLAQSNKVPPPGHRPPGPGGVPGSDFPPLSQPARPGNPPEVEITSDNAAVVTPDIRFDHLTTEEGLSNNAISTILQDRRGFMWIGRLYILV